MDRLKSILVVGPVCGSKGGVNIHLNRLSELLNNDYQFTYLDESHSTKQTIVNVRNKEFIKILKLFKSADTVFIHTGVWYLRIIYILIARLLKKRIVVTIHAWLSKTPLFQKISTQLSLKFSDDIITVNQDIGTYLNLKKTLIKPAFIPPTLEPNHILDSEILKYISNNKFKIISANAFRIDDYFGKDMYGIDLAIDLAKQIKNNKLDYKIIFIISTIQGCENKYLEYEKIINSSFLQDYILLFAKEISFVNLILKSDLIIRPTRTDGDALTIREALYLNTPILASDVVNRPEGTYTFKNGDAKDLFEQTQRILKNNSNIIEYKKENLNDLKIFYKNLL